MKSITILSLLSAIVMLSAQALGQAIVLDSVGMAGLRPGTTDTINTGQSIHFYIRFNNNTLEDIITFTNSFRIYSPDGAQWATSSIDTPADASARGWGKMQFAFGYFLIPFNADGQFSDTVSMGGFSNPSARGAVAGTNNVAAILTIGPIPPASYDGKHICIDSVSEMTTFDWLWADPNGLLTPAWSGPHCYTIWTEITGVNENAVSPHTFSLSQNYPNPFNPTTEIYYSIGERSVVELSIYNVVGQKVRTLVHSEQSAGAYSMSWDGTSSSGAGVASGFYYYRLKTDKFTSTKKMLLVK